MRLRLGVSAVLLPKVLKSQDPQGVQSTLPLGCQAAGGQAILEEDAHLVLTGHCR